jgi:5-methylthioadenosine/S-adenosylhomocysteine deaminase
MCATFCVDGRFLLRNQTMLTIDEEDVLRRAQIIADRIDVFLAAREDNLLDKILAIGGVQQSEIFEVQAKAANRPAHRRNVSFSRSTNRYYDYQGEVNAPQYDTYFLWDDEERGRIRIRERSPY